MSEKRKLLKDFLVNKYEILLKIVLIFFSLAFVCLFFKMGNNDVLWCDEIASVAIAKTPFWNLLSLTANDVHPPLYYLILRLTGKMFGFSGPILHFTSTIPYILIVICSLTKVWKNFGYIASYILVILSTFLFCSIHFNVEIRMYSWASFFILMSFLSFRDVIFLKNNKSAIIFVIWSLMAAYTHYFCIITVVPFYLTILIKGIIERKPLLSKSIMIWMTTIILYLPWAISFLLHYEGTTSKIYSARYNSIYQCVNYIFSCKFSSIILALFCLVFVNSYYVSKDKKDFLWMAVGVSSVVLTILVPFIISEVMSPIMEERHVYPSFIISWLSLGVCVSKSNYKWILSSVLFLLIVPFGIRSFVYSCDEEYKQEIEKNIFLEKTSELMTSSDIVISDEWQVAYPILQYYYRENIDKILVTNEVELEKEIIKLSSRNSDYWLFLTSELNTSIMNSDVVDDYTFNLIVDHGLLGSHRIWVYRCIHK